MKHIIIIILTLLSITINAQGIRLNSKQSVIDSTRLNATGDSLYYYQNGVVLRVEGITGAKTFTSDIVVQNEETNTNAAELNLYKKNGSNSGEVTVGDNIGNINFKAENGATTVTSASIEVDATTLYQNEIGGDMVFKTASNFHSRPLTEAMRIDKLGNINLDSTLYVDATNNRVGIGTSSPSANMELVVNPVGNNDVTKSLKITNTSTTGNAVGLFLNGQTKNANLGLGINDTLKALINYDTKGFVGFLNFAYSNKDFALRLQDDGSLRYVDPEASNATRFIVQANGNVGIGTSSPSQKLEILNGHHVVKSEDGTNYAMTTEHYSDIYQRSGRFKMYRSGGTSASPTNVKNTYTIGLITFTGFNGTDNTDLGARFGAYATDDWANGDTPAKLQFETTPNGSGTAVARMTILDNGDIGIGTSSPSAKLHTKGTTDDTALTIQDDDGTCTTNPEAGIITFSCTSDQRIKTNIRSAENVLSYIIGLPIKEYNVINTYESKVGPIAQELLNNYPELVTMGQDGLYKVSSISQWKVIKAIQEQQEQIETQQQKITDLETTIQELITRIEILENK